MSDIALLGLAPIAAIVVVVVVIANMMQSQGPRWQCVSLASGPEGCDRCYHPDLSKEEASKIHAEECPDCRGRLHFTPDGADFWENKPENWG